MIPTFSGNSKRARNVNLSGRITQNPFAKIGSNVPAVGTQNAIAAAQQDRVARQQERERREAASRIQKSWRHYSEDIAGKNAKRRQWDELEGQGQDGDQAMTTADDARTPPPPYRTQDESLVRLERLLDFLDVRRDDDCSRLDRYFARADRDLRNVEAKNHAGTWISSLLYLERTCLNILDQGRGIPEAHQHRLIDIVLKVIRYIPQTSTHTAQQYYQTLATLARRFGLRAHWVLEPIQVAPQSLATYEALSQNILTLPELRQAFQDLRTLGKEALDRIFNNIDTRLLGAATSKYLQKLPHRSTWSTSAEHAPSRLALLTHIIYCYRCNVPAANKKDYASDHDFVVIVGKLLSSLVHFVQIESATLTDSEAEAERRGKLQLDEFQRDQINSLVDHESVAGFLTQMIPHSANSMEKEETPLPAGYNDYTRIMASYILTLLRMFPRKGDDIRMWLYMGPAKGQSTSVEKPDVIDFFWRAASDTAVFAAILSEPRAAIQFLKSRTMQAGSGRAKSADQGQQQEIDEQWRLILIFVELYSFVLKVMDDEQFFSTYDNTSQKNALTTGDIRKLSTFLKHLGFTMYYSAAEIMNTPADEETQDFKTLFGMSQDTSKISDAISVRRSTPYIAGVQGMTLDYVKGLVNGLVRAIYERDSRRPFLPTNHWLMTSRFDMTNFIDAVVEEEERRHIVQIEDDEDMSDGEPMDLEDTERTGLVGTSQTQRHRRIAEMQRQQRKASRRRYLQTVAPRLEILQNMPFIIPFTTRVQIFRRFVFLDQKKSRGGLEPDMFHLMNPANGRHQAKIRRENEFEDAYNQFYDLGPALKQPISITFMDKFGTQEAGIDGGGVTKEFLTTVTSQAFRTNNDGINMFVENDQHLLYPNPAAVEETKELLKESGIKQGTDFWRSAIQDLLQRYEFLGRIIGKCLYENILVDVDFAGFFLLKWALTGGYGQAPMESGYRANLNDLRDFDEGLYQGLLKLKNYQGDVSDFGLTFSVTDTITIPQSFTGVPSERRTKSYDRELYPGGSQDLVVNSNRLVYISYLTRYRLTQQPYQQSSAFLRGLASIISPSWLRMFNQQELSTLIGGSHASSISISDLRSNTVYGGLYVIGDDGLEHPSVALFWEVLHELEEVDVRKVLKFVTSTPRAPLLGWKTLNPRFSIRDAGTDETRLPSTSTCVNLLKLPRYSKKKTLKEKLLLAVNAGAGFDLS